MWASIYIVCSQCIRKRYSTKADVSFTGFFFCLLQMWNFRYDDCFSCFAQMEVEQPATKVSAAHKRKNEMQMCWRHNRFTNGAQTFYLFVNLVVIPTALKNQSALCIVWLHCAVWLFGQKFQQTFNVGSDEQMKKATKENTYTFLFYFSLKTFTKTLSGQIWTTIFIIFFFYSLN